MFEGATAHDVTAHGKRVRAYESGEGPTLIFLHDVFADADSWNDVAPSLGRGRRVIAIDFPGFGESEQLPETRFRYDLVSFSEVVLDVAASRGATRFSICGHGLGGAVALDIASRHPDLVEKLVLVAPIVYDVPRGLARLGGVPVLGSLFLKQLVGRRIFASHQRTFMRRNGGENERIDARFQRFSRPSARSSTAATLANTRDLRTNVASVALVRAPTLVIWGADDRISPLEQGRRIVRELSGARFDIMDSGHSPHEEVPEAFVSTVAAFLSSEAQGAPSVRSKLAKART